MCKQYVDGMEFIFENWTPTKSFGVYTEKDYVGNKMIDNCLGFEMPKSDLEKLDAKIKETEEKLLNNSEIK
jgi:hypothetical protein